jgi:hypothetical protein
MHLVIITGAFLTEIMGDSVVVLMLIIVAKVMKDIRSHIRERSIR